MKNLSTPRTLAECRFEVGYPIVEFRKPGVLPWVLRVIRACFG